MEEKERKVTMAHAGTRFTRLTDYRCHCKDRLTPEELAKNQEKGRLRDEFLCDRCEEKKKEKKGVNDGT